MPGLPTASGTRFARDFSSPVSPALRAPHGEMRRVRPMLGTFVEIFASGPDATRLVRCGYLPVVARPSAAHGTIRFGRNRAREAA